MTVIIIIMDTTNDGGGTLELTLDFHKYNFHFLNYKFLRGTHAECMYGNPARAPTPSHPPHSTNQPERGGDSDICASRIGLIYYLLFIYQMETLTKNINLNTNNFLPLKNKHKIAHKMLKVSLETLKVCIKRLRLGYKYLKQHQTQKNSTIIFYYLCVFLS